MDDITIGVTEFVNNILVSAQPNDQTIDITVTETVETVLLDVSTTVEEVTVTATQNVIVENITVDYVNNENNIDINVTDATQDVTLNITPTLVEINILRSGGEVNILQFDSLADFPSTGSTDYFYLAKDTNKLYRWTGSAYAEISATSSPVWGQIIGTLSEQTDLQNALNLKAPINSPTFTGTVSGITKTMVGLGAVDNTSDLDKPISTATQTALNNKQPLDADLTSIAALSDTFGLLKKTANNSYTIDTNTYLTSITSSDVTTALGFTPENAANKGVNNGYASLDGGGKVPSSQLPSYVDDVIEVSSYGTLPTTGETGKIYITLDTNKIYRWTGSVYVEVSSSAAVWGGITGTLSNQTDLQSALDAKQDDLNGTGFVKASGTTISYDNTTYYPASNPNGYTTNTGTVTSVALSVPSAFSVSGSPITSSGTLAITGAGTTAQYVRGDGTLATLPDIAGFVPYTGATGNVNLGTHTIIAAKGTFSSSGSSDTVGITHSSGSGIALNISKGGNGEGIYVNKTSGSGNAVTIIGTLNATTLVKNGGTSSQFLKADGSVDSNIYLTSASLSGYVATTGDQTIAGLKTFSGFALFDHNIFIKQGTDTSFLSGYNVIDASSTGIFIGLPNTYGANLVLSGLTTQRNFTFPDAAGTIALTSDIPSLAGYVATTGDQSISGNKTFTTAVLANLLKFNESGGFNNVPGYTQIGGTADNFIFINGAGTKQAQFIYNSGGGNNYTLPTGNGTLALTSDLHNAVTIGTANGLSLSTQVLSLALASTTTTGALSSTDWNTFNNKASTASLANYLPLSGGTISTSSSSDALRVVNGGTGYALYVQSNSFFQGDAGFQSVGANAMVKTNSSSNLVAAVAGTDYVVPSALSAYLPLSGGTLTGALSGTSSTFSSTITSLAASGQATIIAEGSATNGEGAIQVKGKNSSGTSRTAQIKYDNADIVRIGTSASIAMQFETSDTVRLTIASTGAATFSSSVTSESTGLNASLRIKNTTATTGVDWHLYSLNNGNFGLYNNTSGNYAYNITSAGNVGIGTTAASEKLHVAGNAYISGVGSILYFDTDASSKTISQYVTNLYEFHILNGRGNSARFVLGNGSISLGTSATPQFFINTGTGNVGIGTTSPSQKLDIRDGNLELSDTAFSNIPEIRFTGYSGGGRYIYAGIKADEDGQFNGHLEFWTTPSSGGYVAANAASAERMRITSGGDVLVGMTSATGAGLTSVRAGLFSGQRTASGDTVFQAWNQGTTGDNKFVEFYTEGGTGTFRGRIDYNRAAGQVRYNVTSDYRLKTDLKQFNGSEILNKVKVYDYQLKETGARVYGVMAHELQEVLPYAVSGVKDGEQMQGVDYSKIVPVMVQAIKELKAELDTLKNK
jgi:hypothetical protein